MEDLLRDIKSACDHSWGLFFIFCAICATYGAVNDIKTELHKTNSYLEQLVKQTKPIDTTVVKNKSIK